MKKTNLFTIDETTLCVPRERLPQLLGCGQSSADKLAIKAGARIRIGKRVLIKLDILNDYLREIAE